jgi:putative peptidoglycan binding protein
LPIHVVQEGECLNSIAAETGFFWDTLWYHESNAGLRTLRDNPNVLKPGDKVNIPEKRVREESGQTDMVHTFRMKGVPVRLNFHLVDRLGNPRVGLAYKLKVDGSEVSGNLDDDGRISEVIPPAAKKATLTLDTGEKYEFDLGYLEPVDTNKGLKGRLKNLGYYNGEISNDMDDATRDALKKFQLRRGLTPSGEATPETRSALLQEHEG